MIISVPYVYLAEIVKKGCRKNIMAFIKDTVLVDVDVAECVYEGEYNTKYISYSYMRYNDCVYAYSVNRKSTQKKIEERKDLMTRINELHSIGSMQNFIDMFEGVFHFNSSQFFKDEMDKMDTIIHIDNVRKIISSNNAQVREYVLENMQNIIVNKTDAGKFICKKAYGPVLNLRPNNDENPIRNYTSNIFCDAPFYEYRNALFVPYGVLSEEDKLKHGFNLNIEFPMWSEQTTYKMFLNFIKSRMDSKIAIMLKSMEFCKHLLELKIAMETYPENIQDHMIYIINLVKNMEHIVLSEINGESHSKKTVDTLLDFQKYIPQLCDLPY